MAEDNQAKPNDAAQDFEAQVERGNAGLLREIRDLIVSNKKWWLIPVVLVLLLIGVIILLGTSAAAPFLYPLF
jgi:hypothetical protein